MKKNFKPIIATLVLLAVIAIMALLYHQLKPEAEKGDKEITVEVIIPEEEPEEFVLDTDAEYLRQALEEANLIKGTESEYGLYITEVNNRVADSSKEEWWCITKSGEEIFYGVDEIAIADGDHYEITLTIGY
ncbi:MAG: DUF4430 domain-containing protein [Clostridiales bacterium]|jgi:hypothetical protein|nr:DUF4430 domain-containing protein [Clostridiales bacterium]